MDAPPFSYHEEDQLKGYSVDLCKHIAQDEATKKNYDSHKFILVTAQDRFTKLYNNEIDILCEATTVTLNLIKRFRPTLYTFLSGASFMHLSNVSRNFDKKAVHVGVLGGTTTQDSLKSKIIKVFKFSGINIGVEKLHPEITENHNESIELFKNGKIDFYFADREILLFLKQKLEKEGLKAHVSKAYYTTEPYALFLRLEEAELQFIANSVLRELYMTGKIKSILLKNFKGKVLSESLFQVFRLQQLLVGRDPISELQ